MEEKAELTYVSEHFDSISDAEFLLCSSFSKYFLEGPKDIYPLGQPARLLFVAHCTLT